MRVIDWVLRNTASQGTTSLPAGATCLAEILVRIVGVGNRANSRHAIGAQIALFTAFQTNNNHAAITADNLDISTGRASDLAALAWLHFNVVNDRTNRHLRQQHRVAWLDVGLVTSNHAVANVKTLRCNDIGQFIVCIFDQRDKGGAVRIIFEPFDRRRHIPFAPLEVDETIFLLVTTGDAARSDMTLVVPATRLVLAFDKLFDRLAFPQAALVDQDKTTPGGACRFIGF